MSKMLNIPSYINDPSYRYKMPKVETRIEGRGNGIKTNVCNMADVAQHLKVPPAFTTKYLGCELGALSKWEDDVEKSIVNGAHETDVIAKLIDKFIEKFVLCPKCKLPETDMTVKKGILIGGCKACGWAGDMDNAHKLVKFIVTTFEGDAKAGGKKDKAARRAEKQAKQKGGGDDDDEDNASDEVKTKKDKKEKKEKSEKKEKKEKKKKSKDGDSDSEEGEKKEKKEKKDKKEKKEKKEKKDKKEKKAKKADSDADSDSDDQPVTKKKVSKDANDEDDLCYDDEVITDSILRVRKLDASKGSNKAIEKYFDEVRMIQIQNAFTVKMRLYVVLAALFGEKGELSAKDIAAKMDYVEKMVGTPVMPVADICYAFETFYHANAAGKKAYPMVLKELYDAEVVSDKDLIQHYDPAKSIETPGYDAAKETAQPFIDWLKQESDSDSGSDSGSDVDVGDI